MINRQNSIATEFAEGSKPLVSSPIAEMQLHGYRPNQALGETFPAMYLVRTSWIVRWVARVTFWLLASAIIGMIFLPWQQTARGYGRVVALDPQERPQTVTSTYEGVIKYVQPGLREGSPVKQGELIMELEPFAAEAIEQLRSQIGQIELKRQSSLASKSLADMNVVSQSLSGERTIESVEKEIQAALKKWEQQEQEVEALQAVYRTKDYDRKQAETLFPKGLISEQELVAKRNQYDEAYAKLVKSEAAVQEYFATLNAKEKELESKRQDLAIKNQEAQQKVQDEMQKLAATEKDLTDLNIKMGEFQRLKIVAPRDGLLHEMHGLEGSATVKKGDSLFTVVPSTTKVAVELTVVGRDMPLVHVGDKVRLQFQGWPAVQFVGWPSVAVGTFGGQVVALSPTDNEKGDFSLLVEPDPSEHSWPDNRYLRQGVRASGWVLLMQVSLGYEIWRQLNGFPPVIADQEPSKDAEKASKIKLPK